MPSAVTRVGRVSFQSTALPRSRSVSQKIGCFWRLSRGVWRFWPMVWFLLTSHIIYACPAIQGAAFDGCSDRQGPCFFSS